MKRTILVAAIAAVIASPAAFATASDTASIFDARASGLVAETYIVLFDEPGLLHNDGTRSGFAATSPAARGTRKLDARSPAAVVYRDYLRDQQDFHLGTIESALAREVAPAYRYEITDNGVAFAMTADEAARVARLPGVKHVRAAGTFELTGDRQPFFIGADSIWNGTAVPAGTPAGILRGQGVVVGVVDSGVNLTHPSYAPMGAECGFATATPKLLQARNCIADSACTAGAAGNDLNGHGSHTAATATGNVVAAGSVAAGPPLVPATTVQGVAPCASLITYRVCEQSSCDGAAIFAAFQRAIVDQVDVVNFSISGGTNPWTDNDRLKLDAVAADIFVAASAGNNSQADPTTIGRVNHRGPWVMSVANSSDDRPSQGINTRIEISVASPTPPAGPLTGLIAASGLGAPLASGTGIPVRFNSTNALGCTASGAFPPGFFTGAIALIQRGTCPFEEKLNNAQAAGAIGGIIFNNAAGVPNFAPGAATLPSAALQQAVGEALRDFIVANGVTPTTLTVATTARSSGVLNAGSLRGPNSTFDVSKPDITGPGTNIYDAFIGAVPFAFLTGTSMSGPHIAGGGALIRAVRPTWTPMEVHSALMMTADRSQWLPDITTAATPDDVGTGMINLRRAALAGFVLNETFTNFRDANPATGGNPRTLNIASMRNTACSDVCTFSRTIRNTLTQASSWTVSVTTPPGVTIDPIPGFTFAGAVSETRAIPITVRIAPGTTLAAPVFAEVRFTEAGGLSPALVWTVAIRGTGTAPADLLMRDGYENLQ